MAAASTLTRAGNAITAVHASAMASSVQVPCTGISYADQMVDGARVVHDVFTRLFLDRQSADLNTAETSPSMVVANMIHSTLDAMPQLERVARDAYLKPGAAKRHVRSILNAACSIGDQFHDALTAWADGQQKPDQSAMQAHESWSAYSSAMAAACADEAEFKRGLVLNFGWSEANDVLADESMDAIARQFHELKCGTISWLELLGAFRESMQAQVGRKLQRSELGALAGVHQGRNLRHALSRELALMANPATALMQADKFSKGQMMQYEHVERLHAQNGPVAILLDRSGSMNHKCSKGATRMAQAQVLALAVGIALAERGRQCCIIPFNADVDKAITVDWSCTKAKLETMRSVARIVANGGTDFNAPVAKALRSFNGTADVLLITDGRGAYDASVHASSLASRRLAYIVLGTIHDVVPGLKDAATWMMAVHDLTDAVDTASNLVI